MFVCYALGVVVGGRMVCFSELEPYAGAAFSCVGCDLAGVVERLFLGVAVGGAAPTKPPWSALPCRRFVHILRIGIPCVGNVIG